MSPIRLPGIRGEVVENVEDEPLPFWDAKQHSIRNRIVRRLWREQAHFSPVFYEQHRARLVLREIEKYRSLYASLILFGLGALFFIAGYDAWRWIAIAAAAFAYFLITDLVGRWPPFKERIVPFFERPLGVDTFQAGTALLWNSQALDAIARDLGVTPLSEFGTGDPVLHKEIETLFEPTEALATTQALLRTKETALLGESVVADLDKLRHALALAVENQVKFCLHLRTARGRGDQEMYLRNGSYF